MLRARAWIWPACALVAVSVLGDCTPQSTDAGTTTSVSSGHSSGSQGSYCTCECCDGSVRPTDYECQGCGSVCSERGGQLGIDCTCAGAGTCPACENCASRSCSPEYRAMTEHPQYEQIKTCVGACVRERFGSCIETCLAADCSALVALRAYYRCIGCGLEKCNTPCVDNAYFGPLIEWACGEGSSSCDGGAGGVAGAGVGGRGGGGG